MNEFNEAPQSEQDSNVLAILRSPQASTSVTKFAGPYISSIVLQNNAAEESSEENS